MKTVLRVLVFGTMLVGAAWAQPPAVEWSQVYGGTGFESMWNMIPVPGGRYLFVGQTTTYGAGQGDWWIVMVDAVGATIWERTYGTALNDVCTYASATSDGGFVGVGVKRTALDSDDDGWLIRLDSNGDSLWSRQFGGVDDDIPYWVEQTADGGFIVTGSTLSFATGDWDGWLVKFDAGGLMQWERRFGGLGDDALISVVVANDGGYTMSGFTESFGAGDYDAWLVHTDAAGDSLWGYLYGAPISHEVVLALDKTADGGYFTTGYVSTDPDNTSPWLALKTDASGTQEWLRTYGDPAAYNATWQGQQLADGGYIIGGYYQYPDSGDQDLAATRLDANGDSLWTLRVFGDGSDYGWFAYTTPDGGFLLGADTYSSWSAGDADWLVVKTESLCDDQTPETPTIVIDNVGSDVVLHWPPVTESLTGCQIEATHYLVFYTPNSLWPYYYHGYTTDTVYTHLGVIAYSPAQYYYVLASTAPIPTLLMPSPDDHATVEQVLEILERESPQSETVTITPVSHQPSGQTQTSSVRSPLDRLHRHR